MRLQTYRRKEAANYAELQDFLDELSRSMDAPTIFEMFSEETAQIERLTFLSTRKVRHADQFNFQVVVGDAIENDVPVVLGTKGILGQAQDVQFRSSSYFATRQWDWRVSGDQGIEVVVKWDPPPLEPVRVLFNVFGE